MKFTKVFLTILFIVSLNTISGQELNVTVQVNSIQAQGIDKTIFEVMRTSMQEFINNTKWTSDQFQNQEKIEATMLIQITSVVSNTDFQANCQIEIRRPIFNSSYSSLLFNYKDEDFNIHYVANQPFEYNEGNFTNNLTALCAYYAYIILAYDYDSFSNMGGTPYILKAQTIVNNAQNSGGIGWKAFEGSSTKYNNRFYIVENALNPAYKPIREAYYFFHFKGLDIFYSNPEEGRKNIYAALEKIESVYNSYPTLFCMTLFFNAKPDELINIYSQASSEEKQKVLALLTKIDPPRSNKYQSKIK